MPQTKLTGESSDLLKIVLPAAARGDLDTVKKIVKADSRWVNCKGPHGRTMLWEAVNKNRIETVKYLIKQGADINAHGCYYTPHFVDLSPLCLALYNQKSEMAELLKTHGAKVDIFAACYLGDFDFVKKCIKRSTKNIHKGFVGFSSHKPPNDKPTPLHYAVAGAQLPIAKFLIENGAVVKPYGGILLRWAVWRAKRKLVELLLEHGADPNDSGIHEWATEAVYIKLAAQYGYKFDIDSWDNMGYPALIQACRGNHNAPDNPYQARKLLDQGANVNARDSKEKTALHRAAQAGFIKIINLLLKHGAEVNAQDEKGETPLFDAVRAGRKNAIELLLKKGADANLENKLGQNVLLIAQRSKKTEAKEIVKILSDKTA